MIGESVLLQFDNVIVVIAHCDSFLRTVYVYFIFRPTQSPSSNQRLLLQAYGDDDGNSCRNAKNSNAKT